MNDIDTLPFLHESAPRTLRDYDKYPGETFQHLFATRACPYNCYFCGSRNIWGRTTRWRSAENVGQEIAAIRKLGLRHIHFDDDTFGVNPKYILELCDAINRHAPGTTWSCELHTKLCRQDTLRAMAASGCTGVQVGIESGSNWMLKQIRKNTRIEESLAACQRLRNHDIFLSTFFIIGFPRETEQTLAETVKAMKKVKADRIIYSIFTPYPGTETFKDCKALGLIDDNFDISRFNHQSPENCFVAHIPKPRFRQLARRIERMIDRRNAMIRLRRALTVGAVKRLRRIGQRIAGHNGQLIAADRPRTMVLETDVSGTKNPANRLRPAA